MTKKKEERNEEWLASINVQLWYGGKFFIVIHVDLFSQNSPTICVLVLDMKYGEGGGRVK